jgi:hypothetical protein
MKKYSGYTITMWATDYVTNNNATNQFPGIVQDGRTFTVYQDDTETFKHNHGIQTNSEYRKYLMDHANELMKMNFKTSILENKTPIVHQPFKNGSPYLIRAQEQPYGYETSFAKEMYLTRQMLDDKKRRPMQRTYMEDYTDMGSTISE